MTDLGTLGGTFGSALGLADDGRIVGTANIATGENHAFLWQSGKMTDLGTLDGARSSANAIKGSIIVGSSATSGPGIHAVRWNVDP
jgi:probable HAF family extracellular repeat protein